MILVDTSIWIDHLRAGDPLLVQRLEQAEVLIHPFVIGELALGGLRNRDTVLGALGDLPQAPLATDYEVMRFIDQNALYGTGVGYVDAHLLASVRLAAGSRLWSRDRRLLAAATKLGFALHPKH